MPARKYFPQDWVDAVGLDVLNSELGEVSRALVDLRGSFTILPPAGDPLLFQAFRSTPYEKVRVVILGQDPYHDGSFNGLAFGNGKEDEFLKKGISPSLKHILQEVERTEGVKANPNLYLWAKQGVLLINTAHTVVEGVAGMHVPLWEGFTSAILQALQKKEYVVWMLWGLKARAYKDIINPAHTVLEAGHPSPLNSRISFAGCGHFQQCNLHLKEKGYETIVWG